MFQLVPEQVCINVTAVLLIEINKLFCCSGFFNSVKFDEESIQMIYDIIKFVKHTIADPMVILDAT